VTSFAGVATSFDTDSKQTEFHIFTGRLLKISITVIQSIFFQSVIYYHLFQCKSNTIVIIDLRLYIARQIVNGSILRLIKKVFNIFERCNAHIFYRDKSFDLFFFLFISFYFRRTDRIKSVTLAFSAYFPYKIILFSI